MTSTKTSNDRQSQSKKLTSISLPENFHQYLRLRFANSKALRRNTFKSRHNVYCNELGWENERREQMETDNFVEYAYHCVLEQKVSKTYSGCVRVVIPSPYKLAKVIPFEAHCLDSIQVETFDLQQLPRGRFGEISRLAVPVL